MPSGDAVQRQPTLDEQVAEFKGFSTVDGEISNAAVTAEEKAAAEARDRADEAAKIGAAGKQPDGEETPPGDPENKDGKDPNAKTDSPARRKPSAEERIADITKKFRTTERDLQTEREARAAEKAEFERRLAALERGEKSGLTTQRDAGTKPNKTRGDTEPNANDYEFGDLDVRYIEDRTRYAVRQELKSDREASEQTRQREAATREAQELTQAKDKLADAGAAKYDDFDEVVMQGAADGEWPLTPTVGKLLLKSDVGHDVAYHLATHVDEAREIAALSPELQAARFGRLEARFSSSADATAPQGQQTRQAKVPKAPPPPEHRARGGSGSAQASDDTTDFAAFERLAMAPTR